MARLFTFCFVRKQAGESQPHPSGPAQTTKKMRGCRDPCLHRKDTHSLFCEVCREFSALAILGKGFLQLAWLHVIQTGVYFFEKLRKSAAHHACQQASAVRQVLEHVICEGMQLAVEERPPRWIWPVTLRSLRMKKTMTSEIVQIANHGDLLVFPRLCFNLSCTCFLAFLQILYLHNMNIMSCIFHFNSVPVLVFFFCTVLQLLALVFCFGDQVLSPGSSLATDFLGVVPLWRVAQRKFFQPWFEGWWGPKLCIILCWPGCAGAFDCAWLRWQVCPFGKWLPGTAFPGWV